MGDEPFITSSHDEPLSRTLCADDFLTSPLNTLDLTLPPSWTGEQAGVLALALEHLSLSYSCFRPKTGSGLVEEWTIQWLMDHHPDLTDCKGAILAMAEANGFEAPPFDRFTLAPVPDVNWLEKTYQQFAPFSIGRFLIYGSHSTVEAKGDQIPLMIDAATAFGSGDHGTTRGCMEMMQWLFDTGFSPGSILDMGTGSGILAIAAMRLWPVKTLAVDNDRESVRVAALHRDGNGVPASAIDCVYGDGYKTQAVQDQQPFDLVIANILAGPLISMAPDAANATKDFLILSGLLDTQADEVIEAHVAQGFTLHHRMSYSEWSTLLLKRGTSANK